jgi:MFS family permease
MYRHRVPLLLMISMALVGAAYLMIGLSSWYWLTLVALIVIGAGTSLWHAPAFSELAVRYPQRVGFAMAAHSTGAQIGNTTAPVLVGLLLGGIGVLGIEWAGLGWRTIALLLVIPAIMTAAVIAVRFGPALRRRLPSLSPITWGPSGDRQLDEHLPVHAGNQHLPGQQSRRFCLHGAGRNESLLAF